jgi:Na+-translocating ferredoxin:NAD+ oxidoreductase RnfD subunit
MGTTATAVIGRLRDDPRYLTAGFLTFILVVGQVWLRFLESFEQFAIALAFSMGTELALSRVVHRKWPNLVSAYMTGVSIGILVRSPFWWPYAAGSMLAISQKYAVQFRGRHLFNPSNFGLCTLLLAAPGSVAALSKQWTNTPWVMLLIFGLGLAVIARQKKLHLVFSYVSAFVLLSLVRSAITGAPVWAEVGQVLGAAFQLFIFFMITDPKTTPATRNGRIAYALTVAGFDHVFRMLRNQNAPFFALFLTSPLALIIESRVAELKRKAQEPGAQPATPRPGIPQTEVARPEGAG